MRRQDLEYRLPIDFRREPYRVRTAITTVDDDWCALTADIVDPADGRTFATTRCTVQLIDGAGKPLPLSDRIRRALGAAQQPAAWCAESPH